MSRDSTYQTHHQSTSRPTVLLATAQALITHQSRGSQLVRILIDPGSELTLMSQAAANLCGLKIQPLTIPLRGVGNSSSGHTTGTVSFNLRSRISSSQVHLTAHILKTITAQIPSISIPTAQWSHLKNLELADPDFRKSGKIDILIGADSFGQIIKDGLRFGNASEPIAMQTVLGWTILGTVNENSQQPYNLSHHIVSNAQLYDLLTKFWELEEVPESSNESLTVEEMECENHFQATHSRDESGRYIVRLPFKSSSQELGASRHVAQNCLKRLIKRFQQDSAFQEQYSAFMSEYEALGHMQRIPHLSSEPAQVYYLPHHGVVREDSSSTKLRVVFNGSSKTSFNNTLNDQLHIGPSLQSKICDVLLYLRSHRYIFLTDIVKMFRQILIHPEDRNYQRILWTENGQSVTYQLTTVTYGTRSAPYLAGRVLKQLLVDEGSHFPLAMEPFHRGSYVDDIGGGADNLKDLNLIANQVEALCNSGCLPLSKWKSNHPEFCKFSSSLSPPNSHLFSEHTSKILGLSWNCQDDVLTFTGKTSQTLKITKRTITSEAAQLFDPLGLISPVIIKAKIIIQELWLQRVDWDDELSPELVHRWKTFRSELSQLSELRIPRWINLTPDSSDIEFHGFSDASQSAMSAVLYMRLSVPNSPASISLICSKTKVSPIKRLTIPRLELSAALLLARLTKHVLSTLQLSHAPTFLWTDSTTTLAWVTSEPTKWKEFVKNRVEAIQQNSPTAQWKHISGNQNPADCASRGLSASQLISHQLWWSGPSWLADPPPLWPSNNRLEPSQDDSDHLELEMRPCKSHISTIAPLMPLSILLHSWTTLTQLLRRTATVFRAISRFKGVPASQLNISPLTPAELQTALLHWIKATQQAYFSLEISSITQKTSLKKSHAFTRLTAFMDQAGIVRVGGRLQNSTLDTDSKHPAILPKDCTLSNLIIADSHKRTLHGGAQLTLAHVRKKCWILGGRAPVKSFIHRCITCTRMRGVRSQQLMGQLPTHRVSPSLTFQNTGVDYAGPVSLKFYQGRGTRCYKGWIAVFICLSTSAMHLEVVTDYSAEGFLKAFRRFTGRRGICNHLYSDCGTNFKGADLILQRLLTNALKESFHLHQALTNDGTQWHFNPPGAPHMGGKWEAAVKSLKYHLQRTISDTLLTYEDFSTFLIQVEAVLNSRPLSALSEDPDDLTALTPGHFIRGAAINTVPEPDLTAVSGSRLSQLQRVQERLQHFWDRWTSECLQSHLSISKWNTSHKDISVGSLVLISDERYPPTKWPLARVLELHPGRDGLTRVVTLKTTTSTLKRPISKLVLLPTSSATEDSHIISKDFPKDLEKAGRVFKSPAPMTPTHSADL